MCTDKEANYILMYIQKDARYSSTSKAHHMQMYIRLNVCT